MAQFQDIIIKASVLQQVEIGQAVNLLLEIRNDGEKTKPASRLIIYSNDYFEQQVCKVGEIQSLKSVSVNITLGTLGGMTTYDLENTIIVEYCGKKYPFALPIYSFCKNIIPAPPQRDVTYNILLYGIAGATKSSFLNSIYTLLSPSNNLILRGAVGGDGRHVTQALAKFVFEGQNFAIWDTWGLTPNTYKHDELYHIIDGVFPSNWQMNECYEKNIEQIEHVNAVATRHKRQIHGVLFFIPHSALDNQQVCKIISDSYGNLQRQKQLNPMVIITKADEVSTTIRDDPFHGESDADIAALKIKAHKLLNIPPSFISFGINYFTEHNKVAAIDRANLMILKRILGIAQQNYTKLNAVEHDFTPVTPKPVIKEAEWAW